MRRTRRALLASIPAGVALAGCLGDGDDAEETPTPTPEEDPTPTPSPTPGASLTLETVLDEALGRIVVDGEGMVLYMFDSDEQDAGESTCGEDCVGNWPPVTVDGEPETDDTVEAEVTTFEREDGSQQVALDGWPLYYWMGDEAPGDTAGQGVNDVWWVIRGDGMPVREEGTPTEVVVDVAEHPDHGEILVDSEGLTLYNFDQDEQGADESACGEGCVGNWPPMTVDTDEIGPGDDVEADLTTFEREDGSMQVAANGWPLYHWMGDEASGDANGHGVNDVWWVLDAAGQPQRDGED